VSVYGVEAILHVDQPVAGVDLTAKPAAVVADLEREQGALVTQHDARRRGGARVLCGVLQCLSASK
jgi:ABC-type uncharacterized transport system ATPase subunit